VSKELLNYIKRRKQSSEIKLIQIASFTEKKGQLYAVKAFGEALRECPNMHLTLIGDNREDAYQKEVLNLISKYNIETKITVKDFIPYKELTQELSKHHVFIHPSCYAENMNCEGGAPTIIFNAAGSGMPTIGTTHCDIPSLVVNKRTGLLTEEKNIEALSKSISIFYKMEEEEYNSFALASHTHISDNYSIEENAKELSVYYDMLISQKA